MKAVAGCFLLLLATALTDMAGECKMAAFYLELGCTPVEETILRTKEDGTQCLQAFTCPQPHLNATTCYYKGKSFEDKSTIPQALIGNPCSQACSCRVTAGVPAFECAAVDCVETFDTDIKEQCISTNELDSCCSVGNVCGKDAIAKLKTCEVDGKTYKEGESFTPKNTKKTCICTAQWNGTASSEYCRDINCGIEIHYQDKLFGNCAPIFFDENPGCPISFQCPSQNMTLIKGVNVKGVNEKCTFGSLTLAVEDHVDLKETCIRCACSVPPFVTCTKFLAPGSKTEECALA